MVCFDCLRVLLIGFHSCQEEFCHPRFFVILFLNKTSRTIVNAFDLKSGVKHTAKLPLYHRSLFCHPEKILHIQDKAELSKSLKGIWKILWGIGSGLGRMEFDCLVWQKERPIFTISPWREQGTCEFPGRLKIFRNFNGYLLIAHLGITKGFVRCLETNSDITLIKSE